VKPGDEKKEDTHLPLPLRAAKQRATQDQAMAQQAEKNKIKKTKTRIRSSFVSINHI
jgi:hypothetical protein